MSDGYLEVVQAWCGGNFRERDWECREPSWQDRSQQCPRTGYAVNAPECPDHRKRMTEVA